MASQNLLWGIGWFDPFDSLLPDFSIAFTFFTALLYTVLGRHFGRQRPAMAMSVSLSLALALGLIRWEHDHGWSIRSLGPVAVGLALILLLLVLFSAIRRHGGALAGAGLAIGICLIVALTLRIGWPVAADVVLGVAILALITGALLFAVHRCALAPRIRLLPTPSRPEIVGMRRDALDARRDFETANWLRRGLRKLREESGDLIDRPQQRNDVLLQLRRILPAEGWLTERMARLREKAHYVRKGHIARLEETKHLYDQLPTPAKKKAAANLVSRYRELVGTDERLERLDRAVAENERRIKVLTREAHEVVARYEFQKVEGLLKAAEKLQAHNAHLIKAIKRTEQKLIKIVERVTQEAAKGEEK